MCEIININDFGTIQAFSFSHNSDLSVEEAVTAAYVGLNASISLASMPPKNMPRLGHRVGYLIDHAKKARTRKKNQKRYNKHLAKVMEFVIWRTK